MKLSQETLKILKNFSGINSNLLLKENSNLIETIAPQETSMASVTVSETFPVEFGIYDLGQFLGVLDSIGPEDSELEFTKDNQATVVYITSGRAKAKYFSASPSVLIVPKKQINFSPEKNISYTVNGKELDSLLKLSAVLQVPDLVIARDSNGLTMTVCDTKNPTKDNYSIEIPEEREKGDKVDFSVSIKVENLKLMPGEYTVDVHPAGIVRFSNNGMRDLVYYIATSA